MDTSGSIHRPIPAPSATVVVDSSALTFVPGDCAASALATDRISVARWAGGTCIPSWWQSGKLFVGSFIGLTTVIRMP